MTPPENRLYYGDNLDVLREHIATESVDLIYLDPPFNSNRSYNVLFKSSGGADSEAQIQAFDDTWHWSQQTEAQFAELVGGGAPAKVAEAIVAMRDLLGTNDVLAYLVMMTARLVELHRVLKPTGSLYLHCDPTASHYLKVMQDAIFGPTNFRNEIIWRRTGSHGPRRSFGPIHDTLLFYTKSNDYFFKIERRPYTREHVESRYKRDETGELKFISGGNVLTGAGTTKGESGQTWRDFDPSVRNRHWAVPGFFTEQMPPEFSDLGVLAKLDALYEAGLIDITPGAVWPVPVRYLRDGDGQPLQDIWAYQPGTEDCVYGTSDGIDEDVQWLGPTDPERLGYPTQKPLGLLERIIRSSCPEVGVMLDPFCGCGTAVDAAEKLHRKWIGIDITYLAVDLIRKRMRATYGDEIEEAYEVHGIPRDLDGARALFDENPFDFERWVVSLIDAQPNQKQVGDKGIDGVARFYIAEGKTGSALVSVKGGRQLNPAMVRDLVGTVQQHNAEMGIFICFGPVTKGMREVADKSGTYTNELTNNTYPKVQIITTGDLLAGKRPAMPTVILPYVKAKLRSKDQLSMGLE